LNKLTGNSGNSERVGFKRVNRAAAPEIVLEQVKNLILERKYLPGDKLPPERVLSEMTGVSRPSIREAFKTLEALGIVEIKHGSGIYIREPNLDFATFPMTVMLGKGKDIVNELIEARQIVEVEIVALAAQRADDRDLEELRAFLIQRETHEEKMRLKDQFNFDFEALIGKMVKNRILLSVQEATHTLWGIVLRKIDFKPLPVDEINEEHRRIFEAIRAKDAEGARDAMIYHLRAPLRGV